MDKLELNRIYNENCLDTMSRMPDNFIDLIVTSPPYDDMDENFNPIPKNGMRNYKGYTWDFKRIAEEMYRTLKEGGAVIWVVNDPVIKGSESLASSYQKIYFRRIGFRIHDAMIYRKVNPKPSVYNGSHRYEQAFEYIFVLSKGKPKTFNPIVVGSTYAGVKNEWNNFRQQGIDELHGAWGGDTINDTKIVHNIFSYQIGWCHSYTDEIVKGQPAVMPEKLARDMILSWSNEDDLVYDPFMGSGTTAKMALINKRNFIGSELDAGYCDIANERIAEIST